MRLVEIGLIFVSVALSAFSQVMLKMGMTSPSVQSALKGASPVEAALVIARSLPVVGGLACFGLSAVVWLFVLSRVPLSYAYPFVSLGIVATVVAGGLIFRESVSAQTMLGVGLIVAGVVTVGFAR